MSRANEATLKKMDVFDHAGLTAMCFTGFETGRCIYLWWQVKRSAAIGSVLSL